MARWEERGRKRGRVSKKKDNDQMGFWVLQLDRTSVLTSRLLYYVPTEELQGILLSAVLLPHLCIHTQWRTLVTAHVQHPPTPLL